jgi:Dockerin type I domain/PEP-CTERM motif
VNGSVLGDVSVNYGGTLAGHGSVSGMATVSFGGILSPGSGPSNTGTLTLGALSLNSGSQTNIKLAGTTPSSQYDQVAITGSASLAGTLAVSLIGGFAPQAGAIFDILTGSTPSGAFDNLQLPSLIGALTWDASQLYTSGTLSIVETYLPGDFNRDGHVDAADIAAAMAALSDTSGYRTAKGLTDPTLFGLVADVNGDGNFTSADVQALILQLKSGGGSTDSVPEPATIALAGFGFLSIFACVWNRRRFYFLSGLPEGIGAFCHFGLTIVMPGRRKTPVLFLFYSVHSLRWRSVRHVLTAQEGEMLMTATTRFAQPTVRLRSALGGGKRACFFFGHVGATSWEIVMPKLFAGFLFAISTIFAGSVSVSQADTIYTYVNNVFPQNGYTIYGEIVTDGNTGVLSPGDFQTSLVDPLYPATSLSISNSGYVTPLPAYFVQFNGLEVIGDGLYADGSVGISTAVSSFSLSYNNNGPNNQSTYAQGYINGTNKWSDGFLTAPLLIAEAVVPEPATLTLLVLVLPGSGVVYLRRRWKGDVGITSAKFGFQAA